MLGSNTKKRACSLSTYSTASLHKYLDTEYMPTLNTLCLSTPLSGAQNHSRSLGCMSPYMQSSVHKERASFFLGHNPTAHARGCTSCCLMRREALTVLGEQGEDFPFELQPVHLQSRPAKAHRGLENVDDDTQSDNRAEGVPDTVVLEVQVLVRRCQSRGARCSQKSVRNASEKLGPGRRRHMLRELADTGGAGETVAASLRETRRCERWTLSHTFKANTTAASGYSALWCC